MIFNPKTIKINDNLFLHFWYANNKGRGRDNVTIVKSASSCRAATSKKQSDVILTTTTSAWRGQVNMSKRIMSDLEVESIVHGIMD